MQGSHRDSTKQNKDLAGLNTETSSNLNNPSAGAAKNTAVTTADSSDVNKSGPYFDVAASKNVRIINICDENFHSFTQKRDDPYC